MMFLKTRKAKQYEVEPSVAQKGGALEAIALLSTTKVPLCGPPTSIVIPTSFQRHLKG